MNPDMQEQTEGDARLDEVLAEYLHSRKSGQAANREQFLADHPEMAAQLTTFFSNYDGVEELAGPFKQGDSPSSLPGHRACPICRARLQPDAQGPCCQGCVQLGKYQLLAVVGQGTFGIVFRARDTKLDRVVALKRPRPGTLANSEDAQRFLREGKSAAVLDHPAIVKVYEADEIDEVPYITSAFVEGQTLAKALDERKFTSDETADLLATIADALHHAHEKGVLHRDVKPSNILLGDDGKPHLTDFGLALRLGRESTLTADSQALGTPAYMSPEQAEDAHRVDGRSDVYSLGVTLYRMVTGELPFRGEPRMVLHQHIHDEPKPPRRLVDQVPRDLETICLKCLRKEPARRYASAGALAEDLRSFRHGKPIHARPEGRLQRWARWCRRNPALAATGAVAVALLVTVTVVSVGWGLHANRQAVALQSALDQSKREQLKAQEQLAERFFDHALVQHERGETGLGLLWMARSLQIAPTNAQELTRSLRESLAGWCAQLPRLTGCHPGPEDVLAIDPEGQVVWTVGQDGGLSRRALATGKPLGWPHRPHVTAATTSQDGKRVLTAAGKEARLWDLATGQSLQTYTTAGNLDAVALSHDAKTVVTASRSEKGGIFDTTIRRWDVASGQLLAPAYQCDGWVGALALSPDGQTLLAALVQKGGISSWDVTTGQSKGPFPVSRGEYRSLAYSPNGAMLLTGGLDQTARLWDTGTGRPVGPTLFHAGPVRAVCFSRDGGTVFTADRKHTVRKWELATELAKVLPHDKPVGTVAISPDGRLAATGSYDQKARLWRMGPEPSARELAHDLSVVGVLFSPDSRILATADWKDSVKCWKTASAEPVTNHPLRHGRAVAGMAFSPDSSLLVTASHDETAKVWDVATGNCLAVLSHKGGVTAVAFSPEGERVLTGSTDGTAQMWKVTGQPLGGPLPHGGTIRVTAFHPKGGRVLTAGTDGTARLWDAATGKPMGSIMTHAGVIWAAEFSRDGQRVVTGSWDGTARLWDAATGMPLGRSLTHADQVRAVAFSPDGRWVVTGSWDGTARLWDAGTGRPLGPAWPHGGKIWAAVFGPDGRTILTGCDDSKARFWRIPASLSMGVERLVVGVQVATGMELDAEGGARVLEPATWNQRLQRLDELGGPLDR
jgi:WD40 repeat protein